MTTGTRASRRLWRASLANLACLALLWVAEGLVGERHWLTTGLTYMPQHPFGLPTLILLLLSARRHVERALVVNLAAGALFSFALLGVNVPLRVPGPTAGAHIRIMTLNIHHGRAGAPRTLALIRKVKPDVVCIQEATADPGGPDPLPGLLQGLSGWHSERAGDVATLSRWPILSRREHPSAVRAGRPFLETTLDVAGTRFTLLNVHFGTAATREGLLRNRAGVRAYLRHTGQVRARQADAVLGAVQRAAAPVVVAGDLNTPPRGRIYGRLCGTLHDAFRAAGWGVGSTFHARLPLLRIDYVFVGAGVRVERCRVCSVRASDHRAVVSDLIVAVPRQPAAGSPQDSGVRGAASNGRDAPHWESSSSS